MDGYKVRENIEKLVKAKKISRMPKIVAFSANDSD